MNENDARLFMMICVAIVVFVIIWIVIAALARLRDRHAVYRIENLENIRFDDPNILPVIQKLCRDEVLYDYKIHAKKVYIQNGNYSAAFQKDFEACIDRIMNTCFDDMLFRDTFEDILLKHSEKGDISEDQLFKAVQEYITLESGMTKPDQSADMLFNRSESEFMTVSTFLERRDSMSGDYVGVYVLRNVDKQMYYVGQATRLFFRVNQHFTGHGNGDVYADYKYGDTFLIALFKLSESGYDDLDLFEKDMIAKYNAYSDGYNKTVGNG